MKILTKRAIYGSLRSKGLILKLELWLLLAYLNLSKLERAAGSIEKDVWFFLDLLLFQY